MGAMTPSVLHSSGDTCYQPHSHNNLPTALWNGSYYTFDFSQQRFWHANQFLFPPTRYSLHPHIMAASNTGEMEDFQRLSDNYRAELPGPLISEKLPMSVLATEYSQADQIYVVKTEALAQTYSAYRTVKGDGQCGWRGVVFGYFEMLLQLGDLDILQQERVRLQSFEETMRMAGIDYDIIIDMFDYTWELFDDLQKAVERQDKDETVLLNTMNDEVKSDSIVYHFKMMTSAYMQLRADDYDPFLEVPLAEYRVTRIDPSNQEIDQIGLQALTNSVIAPANFALEVLYLDLSTGAEVTSHQFVADPDGKPTIRLLYRPGHYDMIYKQSHSVQVYFQRESSSPQCTGMVDTTSMSSDLQAYLFSGPQPLQSNQETSSYYAIGRETNHSTVAQILFPPQSSLLPLPAFDASCAQVLPLVNTHSPQAYSMEYSSSCSTDMPPSPILMTPRHSPRLAHLSPSPISERDSDGPQIRLNANCFNYHLKHESVPLCTQDYGSAAMLSTAHFRNREFQPHIWRAEEEYLNA